MSNKWQYRKKNQSTALIGDFRMRFPKDLRVAQGSQFNDSIWDWYEESNQRLQIYNRSVLRIDWGQLLSELNLSTDLILELKKYVFFRNVYSTTVFPRTKQNAHPRIICNEVKVIASFLSHLRIELSIKGDSFIQTLTDIEVEDLRHCLASYQGEYSRTIRTVLTNFGSEVFSNNLDHGAIKWNAFDIDTLPWKKKQRVHYQKLPDELFLLLSNSATIDIKQFLSALDIKPLDTSPVDYGENKILRIFNNFKQVFSDYVKYKRSIGGIEHSNEDTIQAGPWSKRMKREMGQVSKLLKRVRFAAQTIIMIYTGARVSELLGFKVGCLDFKDDRWMLRGTVVKGVDITAPTDRDEWIAIPIVCDAVKVLEQMASVFGSKFLFHAFVNKKKGRDKFITAQAVAKAVNEYISMVDIEGVWKDVHISPQQFRNSLVFEMRKARLGLPYITHQLKHATRDLERYFINPVTLMYGGLQEAAVSRAIADANEIVLRDLYHPNSPVTGGGAEKHINRRIAFFQGIVNRDKSIDEILRVEALENMMPLTDVGLGYCQGQLKVVIDGEKTDPPCIGALRCNPVRCPNAVIPEHKIPAWKKSLEENQLRLSDPAFFYAREYHLEAINEAESVIRFHQIHRRAKNE